MTTSDSLRELVREGLSGLDRFVEKPMSGGVQFVWQGRMLCGVMGDDLMLRIDKRRYDEWIVEDGAHPMVMAGQTSKGWILVPRSALERAPAKLRKWIDRAVEFVSTPAREIAPSEVDGPSASHFQSVPPYRDHWSDPDLEPRF